MAHNFYSLARGLGASEVEALCKRQVSATHTHNKTYAENGKKLPLSVWANKGYDSAAIERHATEEDKEFDHKWQWWCYRVEVKSDKNEDEWSNRDQLAILKKARTRALKRRGTDDTEDPKPKGKKGKAKAAASSGDRAASSGNRARPSSSSSSSSSFSSESSASEDEGAKTSGNRGRGNKADKQQEKEQKKKDAVKKKAKAQAEKWKALWDSFRNTLNHDCIDDLAEEITGPVRNYCKTLREIYLQCTRSCKSGVDSYSEPAAAFELKDAKKALGELNKKLKKAARATA